MKISFVIPAYNEEKLIGQCLNSVIRQVKESRQEAEIIVVNNASIDGTKNAALAFPEVKMVDEPKKGLSNARQAGFLASTGDLIANIDADTVLTPHWIDKVCREFSKNENLVALSGPHIFHDLSKTFNRCVQFFYGIGFAAYILNRFVLKVGSMVQGGNFVIRRASLEKIGGFDRRFDFYGEDTDIARRLHKVGDVKFTFKLPIYASGRRIAAEGALTMGFKYGANFIWTTFLKRPFSKTFIDVRSESVPSSMKEFIFPENGIYYRVNEFRKGRPTLVFVHGLTGSASAWLKYEKKFCNQFNILNFDLRGHGKSAKFADYGDYHIEKFSEDVKKLTDCLGIEKFHFICHSYGSFIALNFLKKYQPKVASILFLAPNYAVGKRRAEKFIKPFFGLNRLINLMPFKPKSGIHVDYARFENTGDWNLRRIYADVKNTGLRTYFNCLRQSYEFDHEEVLSEIKVPTLILHGRNDSLFPAENSMKMAQKINNSKIILLDGANHILPLNNFKEISESIENFIV